MEGNNKNVFFALHLYRRPECKQFWSSLKGAVELLKQHGYSPCHGIAWQDPYIQKARNDLVSQFLKSKCAIFIFVADDIEYKAKDLLRLIETPGDVVAGAYRLKSDEEEYPVRIHVGPHRVALTRDDGCILASRVQTGFLRINRVVFTKISEGYPDLAYYGLKNGEKINIAHDFFPQGVRNHRWIGEDYAFCDLWTGLGGQIWLIPDIDLIHYEGEIGYPGNFHEYLKKRPGGINEAQGKIDRITKMRHLPVLSLAPLLSSFDCENGVMAEIGCYTGESTEFFNKCGKFKEIYSIDPWESNVDYNELPLDNMDVVEQLFDKRIATFKTLVHKIRETSMQAVNRFSDSFFDFVYIDGNHEYDYVKEDIVKWLPKVKLNGIIAGHDYNHAYEGVIQAVDEIFGKDNIRLFPDSSWMVKKG
jgi:hypothetical protein